MSVATGSTSCNRFQITPFQLAASEQKLRKLVVALTVDFLSGPHPWTNSCASQLISVVFAFNRSSVL